MQIRLASPLQTDSIVDGEGIRTVIWTQGCSHNCLGCHNPSTHNFNGGFLVDVDKVKEEISKLEFQDGITLSGGDPFMQPEACSELAIHCQNLNLNVWCYTGFTFEQLKIMSKSSTDVKKLLENIDVLIDGKFILSEKSLEISFRGSRNQRVIDVKKSLNTNKVVILKGYSDEPKNTSNQGLFI